MALSDEELAALRARFTCNFTQVDAVFPDCMAEATARLGPDGVTAYLDGASLISMLGRGFEPVLAYLEEMPAVAERLGEDTLEFVAQTVWKMSRTPNGKAIEPFVQSLGAAARRLGSRALLDGYVEVVMDMLHRTTGSIHGSHTTIPSPGLPDMLENVPTLLDQLSLEGFRNWVEYGVSQYKDHAERQRDFFSLQSADARAVMSRERHGTLFADNERSLELYMRALWEEKVQFVPYSLGFDELRKPQPYWDEMGIRVPDVFDDLTSSEGSVRGIDRYRALLAHAAAHRRWSQAIFADNYSPFQRVAVEMFEDCRVEWLAMREYPGLRRLWLKLHPKPGEHDCDPERESCIRHRLVMFSRAVLDPDHGYENKDLLDYVARFQALLSEKDGASTQEVASLAISFIARTRRQQDLSANVYFADTEVDYRDDNRHLWKFIELGDEEEAFDEHDRTQAEEEEDKGLPPRHYPEWDYKAKIYRPDWVSLYESLHPSGDGAKVDALLEKHAALAKRLKQMLDLLKPQQVVRERYQEDGSELDLDIAIRSLVDFKSGTTPDPRINTSHRTDGRDIAVSLLLDLSESVSNVPAGCEQTVLEISQEAVALLAWAIEHLGDAFAIAGFSSNTRHEVRFQHLKGYSERWNDTVKSRLAAMEAGYSTRMGAAMRHAGHYLKARQADKKLLLVLTDGEPADIDVTDERALIEDARKAVLELDRDGVFTYCINLDPKADEYVADIFGGRYTVIDRVERLPEKLPGLFVSLTK